MGVTIEHRYTRSPSTLITPGAQSGQEVVGTCYLGFSTVTPGTMGVVERGRPFLDPIFSTDAERYLPSDPHSPSRRFYLHLVSHPNHKEKLTQGRYVCLRHDPLTAHAKERKDRHPSLQVCKRK